tara:strand:- start:3137 stop:5095 length:1959 start_codon:yes stop_codon:yes gene_type:complete
VTKSFTKFRSRILFLSSIVIIVWAGLTVRFFHIQVINSNNLSDRSKRQGGTKVELSAVRGSVTDRNNNDLASNVVHYSFGIHPKKIENREKLINAFSKATGRQKNYYIERFDRQDSFVFLDRNLRYKIAEPLLGLKDKGLISNRHGYRYYPQKRIASQILGFTNVDNDGIEGIEKQFNKHLKGKNGWIVLQTDGKGRSRRNNSYPRMAPVDGSDIQLTIDLSYQAILQNELQKQIKRTGAKGAMGIIIEPSTGKILAISSLPDFDPNEAATFPPETFRNRVVTDQFEPGSTFKLVSATAALSRKLVGKDEEFNCGNGFYEFRGQRIEDWDKFGQLSFPQIIQNSSNVGIIKISEKVGKKNLYDFGRKYGFGALSGISFPGEAKGVMKRTEKWSKISIAEISIGYEVSVTCLQLALAYSAVANGGFLMKPHIVEKIIHPTGRINYQAEPQVVRRVASKEVMKDLTDMLELVVSKGTGAKANIQGWNVAGKTGTAKKYVDGSYSNQRFIASFAGFFPAHNPHMASVIILDEPKEGFHWGSGSSAPVFKSVIKKIIQGNDSILIHKPIQSKDLLLAKGALKTKKPITNPPLLATTGNWVVVPDVRGRSLRNATSLLRKAGLKVMPKGSGTVVWQNPSPGKKVKAFSSCSIGLGLD